MLPLRMTLSGAIGIRAGLRRDSITLDFSEIPDDAVSVAICGDNGTGKSTILNLGMVPWREPPHIGDIYAQFGHEGRRELAFEHGGEEYRSVITYKQTAKSKKTTAVLYVEYGGGGYSDPESVPYKMLDGTESDGKTSTYDACLEELLGPQSLYYLAAFRHQGIAPLAGHSDPKSLMRDLLALEEPERLSAQAKAVARVRLLRALEALAPP